MPSTAPPDPHRHTLAEELTSHLPFTVGAAAAAILLAHFVLRHESASVQAELFHAAHPLHLLLSGAATAAMVMRLAGRRPAALLMGGTSALLLCTLSDLLIPYGAGWAFGREFPAHYCLIEEPWLVAPSALAGALLGVLAAPAVARSTVFSHTGHVLVSSAASMLALMAFVDPGLLEHFLALLGILVGAVLVPCCAGDIVLPVLLARRVGRAASP